MKKAPARDRRHGLKKIERLLHEDEEVEITKPRAKKVPDFLARLRSIYGDKVLAVSGAELVAEDRNRY